MIILGLTGGIGAGKSFIANEFSKKGIPVYNSDDRAKKLMQSNEHIRASLLDKFGNSVYKNDTLNKALIAEQIFNDKDLINWMNNLVHPIVANDFTQWKNKQTTELLVKEAAILIESGAHKQCDKILVITAPEALRIKRVAERDNMTPDKIKLRVNNQLSDKERLRYADFAINNDGTVVVSEEVDQIIKKLKDR